MACERVDEARSETAADPDRDPGAACVRVERAQLVERIVLLLARSNGNTCRDGSGHDLIRPAAEDVFR